MQIYESSCEFQLISYYISSDAGFTKEDSNITYIFKGDQVWKFRYTIFKIHSTMDIERGI